MGGAAKGAWRRERPRPAAVRNSPVAAGLVVGTVCVGAFMGQLDAGIATLAIPTLTRDLHASLASTEWVLLVYLLTLGSMVTVIGRIADVAGRKLLYIYGFAVFTVGSMLCGLAPTLAALLGARVVQAAGAAMLQANSLALIVNAVPAARLARAIGVQGAAQALGLAVGPAVGGLLIALGGWRWIFFVNVLPGALGIVLGWYLLPRSRDLQERAPLDWPGSLLLAGGASAALLALSTVRRASALVTALLVALAGVFAALLLPSERRARAPLVPPWLMRRRCFTVGLLGALGSYLALFGVLFVVPVWLERARGQGAAGVGVLLSALPLALGVVAPFAARAGERLGTRVVTGAGMLLAAAGMATASLWHGDAAALAVELAVIGAGLGAFIPGNNAVVMGDVPRSHSGVAGGILNLTRGLGTALGVAVAGAVYALASGHQGGGGAQQAEAGYGAAMLALAVVAAVTVGISTLQPAPAPRHGVAALD